MVFKAPPNTNHFKVLWLKSVGMEMQLDKLYQEFLGIFL